MNSLLTYLLQASICQAAFYFVYHFALRKQSFFQANRVYLLLSTCFSFIIPGMSIEVWSVASNQNALLFSLPKIAASTFSSHSQTTLSERSGYNFIGHISSILWMVYLGGVVVQSIKLFTSLRHVIRLINQNIPINDRIIRIKKGPAFFSFWKYTFINEQKLALSDSDLQLVLFHEQVHIRQRHTVDILFMELATIICWFNPLLYRMKQALCQIHEFIADQKVADGNHIDDYSRLILRLSSGNGTFPLTHQFSKIDIKNRITMLNQSKPNKMKALKYLFTLPVLTVLLAFFSFTEKNSTPDVSNPQSMEELTISEIHWTGNTIYKDEYLTKIMGIHPGDIYTKSAVENLLNYHPERTTISDLYMDTGHLFFNINVKDSIINNKVILTFEVYEGNTATIDKIIIKGNKKVDTDKIMTMMEIKKGDLFNRTKLIASQKNIAESGYFKSEEIGIKPIPHDGKWFDIEFTVIEL